MSGRYMHRGAALTVAIALGLLMLQSPHAQNAPGPQVPGTLARAAIDAAAVALGGADRLRALRNITLMGYGQYAYQNGGGNITALPDAPLKLIAANDLKRVYDVEHHRYRQQERRNDLFPFAAYGGHSFALATQVLDGNTAYNVSEKGEATRGGDVRDRRMWMHTNPVVAVRAALDPTAKIGNRRQRNGLTLVDVTIKEGDVFTMAIRPPSNLPAWVAWSGPNQNLGEVVYTTHFFGYQPFGGVRLPMGYTTKLDWRNIEFLKMYVDGYLVDSQIDDLATPASALAVAGRRAGRRSRRRSRWPWAPGSAGHSNRARPVAHHRWHDGD